MILLLLIVFAATLCVPKVFCVGSDYVMTEEKEYEEHLQTTKNVLTDVRRVGQDKNNKPTDTITMQENKSIFLAAYDAEVDSDEEVTTKTTTAITIQTSPVNTKRTFYLSDSSDSQDNRKILDMIDNSYEVDYMSSNDDHLVVRNQGVNDYESPLYDISSEQYSKSARVSYQKLYMPDFYNLLPVKSELPTTKLGLIGPINARNMTQIWYVPENYPCWQLPLLYGQPDIIKKPKEVFLIHAKEIKHIRKPLPSIDESVVYLPTRKKTSGVSKWCQIQPCFGDHTLCMFRNKGVSKICDTGYRVDTPSILDKMSITNTINSMRNRVAAGLAHSYRHLPTAANMQQIMYENDLQKIASVWLHQCLPGPAPCSSLHNEFVTQLECTKYAKYCCARRDKLNNNCRPLRECYVSPILGCIHTWFESAGRHLNAVDIRCGHIERSTLNTVQLLWAKTIHVGCAAGYHANGDVRVACNFSPGAPFSLLTKFYCGIIPSKDRSGPNKNFTMSLSSDKFMQSIGVKLLKRRKSQMQKQLKQNRTFGAAKPSRMWGLDSLFKMYLPAWARTGINGTFGYVASLVTEYIFVENDQSACDADEPVYVAGKPGSLCLENGRKYPALCYNFRDPTPGYRLVAVLAPVALFTLILYDLFSGVVRQTNY